ncbi:MAG: hypothetical protein J6Z22_00750 [Lachnospiraceae bacterium]|nr:hypothetical protein [Lachnospiraceae bacterium]
MEYHEGVQVHVSDGESLSGSMYEKEADRLGKHETFGYCVGSGGFCI